MQSKIDRYHDNNIIGIKEDLKDIKENKVISDSLRESNPLALLNKTSMLQNEVRDSTRREYNLIIKGLKKSESASNSAAASNENCLAVIDTGSNQAVVIEILSNLKSAANLVNLNLEKIYVKWVGVRKGFKSRYVCVVLKSREDVFCILNNAKLLSPNIRVSTDKT